MPGYSTYIHPIDEKKLLTIGYETDEKTGRNTGLKISLFDVKIHTHPKLINSLTTKESKDSQAVFDHLAFTYSPSRKLLLIPWTVDSSEDVPKKPVKRVVNHKLSAFKVDQNGIQISGELAMSSNASKNKILRSMILESYVFAISEGEIRVAEVSKLPKILKTVSLGPVYDIK